MNQKFVIKSPELSGYFSSIDRKNDSIDVSITDEKYESTIFDSFLEAKEWIKRINSSEMRYKKVLIDTTITWDVILVSLKNGTNDFDEIMTWYSTTEDS